MGLDNTNIVIKKQYNIKATMAVLLFGGFLSLFNETILNVAFAPLMIDMNIVASTVQWLSTGYVLVVGILIPVTAFLIHSYTTRRLYLTAMILFLLGTLMAVISSSFTALLIARMIQATGTGMLVPIMMNTALTISAPEKRGSTMGLCVCAILIGPALGPVVSGILLQFFQWQSLFIILIPFVLVSIIGGILFLQNVSKITKPKIDFLSIMLSTIGFGGIIYGISSINDASANRSVVIASFTVGLIGLIFFTKRQLFLKEPMLELRAFKRPMFFLCIILIIIIQMVLFSMNVLLPLLLQNGLNTTPLTSALVLLPSVLISGLTTPFAGKIFDKIGGKKIIPFGISIICIFMWLLSRVEPTTTAKTISILYCFVGFGAALVILSSQTTALNQLSSENQADGIAITSTSMQIAAAIGSTLFIGLMSSGQNKFLCNTLTVNLHENNIKALYSGFRYSMTIAVIIILISLILSLFIRQESKK
ncbi:DHA2 family efflux MFS transporter permease subunit [Clostridium psychrophilum]|uniref:DHA2 family efflux MFS transporter permease subunit n=1 Tax=Clostridium psychrophilum TaxID=132926 RepID=UPI001C0D825F|nr:DHA2 family efflux MFS transporter permease subunit [Clostridium psychrophilum]MBU3181406.1 DHA2 family efflux MFS transporter permease subunit [Clostridium psychrophilum]